MKLGRIMREGKEEYGVFYEDSWYPQQISRSDMGIETYFNTGFTPQLEKSVQINQETITWLPPIAKPGKILCIGRNYAEHSREQGKEPETTPLIFSKFPTSLIGHNQQVSYPEHTENLDYEVELAVVIGKQATKIKEGDNPMDYIFGFTIANDLTARDVQKSEKQWTRGKGFDESCPIGPLIVTKDEIENIEEASIWLTVNGEKRQESRINHMIFSIPYLVKYISQTITLEAGDILLTGTPEGVGFYMDPKSVLQPGDKISSGIDQLGTLEFSIKK